MTTQLITLTSNASLNAYPNNSLSKFVTHLPLALNQPGGIIARYIRLKSVKMHTQLQTPDPYSGYIKIQLDEVEGQRNSVIYERTLGTLKFPPNKKFHEYSIHEFKNAPVLKLVSTPITSFSALITNTLGTQLQLSYGPPTILELEVMEVLENNEFVIHCSSFQPTMFDSNTLSTFACPMPSEVTVKDYDVALLNIVYPPGLQEDSIAKLTIEKVVYTFVLNSYDSTDDFIDDVHNKLEDSQYGQYVTFGRVEKGPRKNSVQFTRNKTRGAPFVLKIKLSKEFQLACGYMLNLSPIHMLKRGGKLAFQGLPDVLSGIHSPLTMVYCDIIKSSIIGDVHGPLLRIVPVLYGKNNTVNSMYEPDNLSFHSVDKQTFSSIGFHLKDPAGRERNFRTSSDSDMVIITLLFRRRK